MGPVGRWSWRRATVSNVGSSNVTVASCAQGPAFLLGGGAASALLTADAAGTLASTGGAAEAASEAESAFAVAMGFSSHATERTTRLAGTNHGRMKRIAIAGEPTLEALRGRALREGPISA
jgi:hypothetical protein